MTRNRRWIGMAITTLALSALPLPASAADWDVDLRAGWYAKEAEGPFVGGGALVGLGNNWFANPNLEVAFGDEIDYLTVNGDFHYDFETSGNLTFWFGGGLAIVQTDGPFEDDTNLGLNALFGVGAKKGRVRPFGQAKLIISDETEFVLMGGIRF